MNQSAERREQIVSAFQQHYGKPPSIWARAPGRVDLMGSHTDYNLGFVLTLAIGPDIWIAASPNGTRSVRAHSVNFNASSSFDLDGIAPDPSQTWSNYIRAIASTVASDGYALQGFDAVIHGTVPIGSGLSSSAALECAASLVFESVGGFTLRPVDRALLCQRAENRFVGVNCGILDQYTSCMGKKGSAVVLDCRDLTSRPVALPPGLKVVICDTRARRELSGSEYGNRRAQCEAGARLLGIGALREIQLPEYYHRERELPGEVARRCRFIVEENARVAQLCDAFEKADRSAIAEITAASFSGACELFEIAVPAMHAMMTAMLAGPGIIGTRQAGAGFGGCMVAFVEDGSTDGFAASVRERYATSTGTMPEIYPVEAAAGAGCF